MINRISIILMVVWIVGFVAHGAAFCNVEATDVLHRMLQSEATAVFIAHQVTSLIKGLALTSRQTVFRNGYRGMRIEYIEPIAMSGEIWVDDGRVCATLLPRQRVLKMGPSRLAFSRMRMLATEEGLRRGRLHVSLLGKDKIAGRPTYIIEVKPRRAWKSPYRRFWIDCENWIKLKTEDIAPDGSVMSTSYYTRIELVDSIPESKFRLEPPAGFRVERHTTTRLMSLSDARKAVRFKLLEPSYLPPGFTAVEASVIPFRRAHVAILRYSDGITSFSLFQTPERALDRKFLERLGEGPFESGSGIYAWREGNMTLTIVGYIPMDEIRKIANSVK